MAKRVDTKNVQRLVNDDKYRSQAKEAYAKHTSQNSNLDVLERCKRLNQFLSNDFLKGGANQKAQLKDILDILNAGPKRPSFLDKPPVTASPGKLKSQQSSHGVPRAALSGTADLSGSEAEQLLALLGDADVANDRPPEIKPASASPAHASTAPPTTSEDVGELIGLLNNPTTMVHASAAPQTLLPSMSQPETPPATSSSGSNIPSRKQSLEVQQWRIEQQQKEQQRIDQERILKQQRHGAAVLIQRYWRGHRARLHSKKLRQQQVEARAACCIQRLWRKFLAQQLLHRLKAQHAAEQVLQRKRCEASIRIQAAYRGHRARLQYRQHKLQKVRERMAARAIQRAWRTYKRRCLGPLRLPSRGRPASAEMAVDPALLAKPVRLRSTADTRLAKELNQEQAHDPADAALKHRTVVTTKQRAQEIKADERKNKAEVMERAQKAGSLHRTDAEAMHIVKAKGG